MMVVPRTTWISRETLSSVANLRSLFLLKRWCDCHHGLVTEWLMLSRGPPVRGGSAPDPEGSAWGGVSASDRVARAVSPPATRFLATIGTGLPLRARRRQDRALAPTPAK